MSGNMQVENVNIEHVKMKCVFVIAQAFLDLHLAWKKGHVPVPAIMRADFNAECL